MTQYKKLFGKSEIEYITPFLKLWMSFNNWYKEDLEGVNRDADAINSYKDTGKIKTEFLRLFDDTSDLGIEFNISLYELILNLKNYPLEYPNGDSVGYEVNLIYENIDGRSGLDPIYISETKRRFQIPSDKKELFFKNTLEVVYQVRCNLVHGSFDIENHYFLKLVEASYKILYPIMERILSSEEEVIQNKKYFDKGYFNELVERINYLLSAEMSPVKKIIEVYATSINFTPDSREISTIVNSFYVAITGQTLQTTKKGKGIATKPIFDFLSDKEKSAFDKISRAVLVLAKEKTEQKIPMTMNDWKKEFKTILKNNS